jgi:thiamine pyrophosphokinase
MSGFLIVGAAPAPDPGGLYPVILAAARVVIAADAAGEWCAALGRVPEATVGDFDSSSAGAPARLAKAGSAVTTLSADKDISDLDACVLEARLRGATALTFTAAFSGRLDHTLAAFGTVIAASDLPSTIEEPAWRAMTVTNLDGPMALDLPESTVFTVISPCGATGVTIGGARYPLANADLRPLSSLGLSNLSAGRTVTISVEVGMLIVIVQR